MVMSTHSCIVVNLYHRNNSAPMLAIPTAVQGDVHDLATPGKALDSQNPYGSMADIHELQQTHGIVPNMCC